MGKSRHQSPTTMRANKLQAAVRSQRASTEAEEPSLVDKQRVIARPMSPEPPQISAADFTPTTIAGRPRKTYSPRRFIRAVERLRGPTVTPKPEGPSPVEKQRDISEMHREIAEAIKFVDDTIADHQQFLAEARSQAQKEAEENSRIDRNDTPTDNLKNYDKSAPEASKSNGKKAAKTTKATEPNRKQTNHIRQPSNRFEALAALEAFDIDDEDEELRDDSPDATAIFERVIALAQTFKQQLIHKRGEFLGQLGKITQAWDQRLVTLRNKVAEIKRAASALGAQAFEMLEEERVRLIQAEEKDSGVTEEGGGVEDEFNGNGDGKDESKDKGNVDGDAETAGDADDSEGWKTV